MKKYKWFLALFIVLCFVVIFSFSAEKTRMRNEEIKNIHQSAELAIGGYLKGRQISKVLYNTLPIYYDKNRCIIGCRVDSADESGLKQRTRLDISLYRDNNAWKATIVKVDKHQPVPKEMKKPAPWEFFFQSEKRNDASK